MKIVDKVTRAYLQLIARQTNKHDVDGEKHKPNVGTIVSFPLEDKKFHRNQSRLRYGLVTGKYNPGLDGISRSSYVEYTAIPGYIIYDTALDKAM